MRARRLPWRLILPRAISHLRTFYSGTRSTSRERVRSMNARSYWRLATHSSYEDTARMPFTWAERLEVSPLRGVLIGGGEQTMKVAVTVTPAHERPGLPFVA